MESIDHEYDHFGPWLLQVESQATIPHQYFEYLDRILAAKYCFKIPVQEERRKLHPGMLLYNKLVILENEHIVELAVINDQITVTEIDFADILYISHSGDLLNCEISVVSKDKTLVLRYNLVSTDFAGVVVSLLRECVNLDSEKVQIQNQIDQQYSDLQIFTYFCITEKVDEKPHILNYQGVVDLGLLTSNNLFKSLNKYRLLDSLFMTNGVEFIIANRGQYVIQEHDTNYKFGHTFIPIKYIDVVSQQAHPTFNHLSNIIIDVQGQQVKIAVAQDFDLATLNSVLPA